MADRFGYRDESFRNGRGFEDRASDEVRSWFGDDEAARRRRYDERDRHAGDSDQARRGATRSSWGGDDGRSDYDRSGSAYRGWNEPNYGYRPAAGYGFGYRDYAGPEPRARGDQGNRYGGETHGYYEDPRGRTVEFDHPAGGGERSHGRFASGRGDELRQDELGRRSGAFTGRGPKGYRRSDERLREDVCDCLADDSHIDASDIEVSVKDGEVTLSGVVRTRDEKRRSEDMTESISGVRDVHNTLRVSSGGATPGNVLGISPTQPPIANHH